MAPQEHLTWLDDNIGWFEQVPSTAFVTPVPNCPGWRVEDVFNHLSFGLGLAYPMALSTDPQTPDEQVFAGLPQLTETPTGNAVGTAFSANMRRCLATFVATDPDRPCWTYAGSGTARFWFRRAAIETALHRMDVADAVPSLHAPLTDDRAADAIAETLEFALPLATAMTGEPPAGGLTVSSPDLDLEYTIGAGSPAAVISGTGGDVLAALWGRHRDRVEVLGDQSVAGDWLSRIELAFAGR